MSDHRSTIRDMIELLELRELEKLTAKKEEKKPPPKWFALNPIKLYIILILLYPFIGKAYMAVLLTLWK